MVADDDDRTGGEKVLFAGEDDEFDAGGPAHGVVEGAGGEVLALTVVAGKAEEGGDEDAVGCADDKGKVGGEAASVKGGVPDTEIGKSEEEGRKAHID